MTEKNEMQTIPEKKKKVIELRKSYDQAIILNYDEMEKEGREYPFFIKHCLVAYVPGESKKTLIDFMILKDIVEGVVKDFIQSDKAQERAKGCEVTLVIYEDFLMEKFSVIFAYRDIFITCPKALGVENFKKILECLNVEIIEK